MQSGESVVVVVEKSGGFLVLGDKFPGGAVGRELPIVAAVYYLVQTTGLVANSIVLFNCYELAGAPVWVYKAKSEGELVGSKGFGCGYIAGSVLRERGGFVSRLLGHMGYA